ncbi:unnamed protein product [Auanema sp. JU1783]|nr:unnamed protein product [Auanema sp. JU1783]
MDQSFVLTDGLKKIFSEFSSLQELPHAFDDSLISKLVDHLEIDGNICRCVLDELETKPFSKHSKVSRSFLSKLTEKAIQSEFIEHQHSIETYVEKSLEDIVSEENSEALYDILPICIALYKSRGPPNNLIQLCLSFLPDESLSIFARRNLEDLVCLVSSDIEEETLNTIVQMFCATKFPLVRNGLCRVLTAKKDSLTTQARYRLISDVQQSRVEGEIVYKLISDIIDDLSISTDRNSWSSEIVRTSICLNIVKRLQDEGIRTQIAHSVLNIARPKLRHFTELLPFLPETIIKDMLSVFSKQFESKTLCPFSDIVNFLGAICTRVERNEFFSLLDHCTSRLFDSPAALEKVQEAFGSEVIDDECMKHVKEALVPSIKNAMQETQWEEKDTAIEIAILFPSLIEYLGDLNELILKNSSPYVRAAALRCFLKHGSKNDEAASLCLSVFNNDNDQEPRRMAISYLEAILPNSCDEAFSILGKALEDPDIDIRNCIISICQKALLHNPLYKVNVVKELNEWTEDPEIGSKIRSLLHPDSISSVSEPLEHILAEMMIGLSIGCTEDIDCY